MKTCKGKTKKGTKCRVKCQTKYCKRHQKGGVKTGIEDLDKHIGKYLTLQELSNVKQVSKHQNIQQTEIDKRKFYGWQLLNDFNRRLIPSEDIQKVVQNNRNIFDNKEFLNIVMQKPVTSESIKNTLVIQNYLINLDDKFKNAILNLELGIEYLRGKTPNISTRNFRNTLLNKLIEFLNEDRNQQFKPKLKKLACQLINEFF